MQNAMNAAEITDKLGLHSLRQRAWVGSRTLCSTLDMPVNTLHSTSSRLVLPLAMVFTKDWNG